MTLVIVLGVCVMLSLSAIALYSATNLDVLIAGNKRRHTQAKLAAESGLSHFMSLNMAADDVRQFLGNQERGRVLDHINVGDGKSFYTVEVTLCSTFTPNRFYVISTGTREKRGKILAISSVTATIETID